MGIISAVKLVVAASSVVFLLGMCPCQLQVPTQWGGLTSALTDRMEQERPQMRLSDADIEGFVDFLNNLQTPSPQLIKLQDVMPKTTIELLRMVQLKKLSIADAEKRASTMLITAHKYNAKALEAFDESTAQSILN